MNNSISQYLKNLTDKTKFTDEEIMIQLKDCLTGKKCCLFSCGANIDEHSNKFTQIKNDKTFITCCIKSSIEYLQFETDILILYDNINGSYLKNNKINNIFILKHCNTIYNGLSYNLSNFSNDDLHKSFFIIMFLIHIGIKEIYFFGYYLNDYIINDLTNYNYYNNIICKEFHNYDKPFTKILEPGIIRQHISSIYIADYCIDNNIELYNVSELGCLSNKIKRINFESLFCTEKIIISSKNKYIDFLDEFNNKVDIDFYHERNCNNSNKKSFLKKKNEVLDHLIENGIYYLNKVNKYDTKKEIYSNDFIENIIELYSYIQPIEFIKIRCIITFLWNVNYGILKFNKLFNVCFYNDFDK